MKSRTRIIPTVAVLVVLALAPLFLDSYSLDVLTGGLIYGLMAMGLAVLVGQAGLPSLGHAAFLGVGGYAAGLLAVHVTANPLAGLLAAALVGAVLSVLLGVISMRAQGIYFLMVSLAVAELIHAITMTTDFTGGDNGLSGIPTPEIPALDALGLPHVVSVYWYVLVVAVVVLILVQLLVAAPLGRAITGSADNADRMRALGYNIATVRVSALVISGVAVAVGGALLTQKDVFIAPTALAPDTSILLLVMVLVGGARSLVGPLIAGIGLVVIRSYTSSTIGDYWVRALGAIFVLTVYFLPNGLAGLLSRRRAAPEPSTSEEAVRVG
ncbi:MAG: branched-chain amino acid ABC transporter permease [Nocardioides sp.]|nr:branched-chain amino acid ABC transporter permease [Nocardioides sp.]